MSVESNSGRIRSKKLSTIYLKRKPKAIMLRLISKKLRQNVRRRSKRRRISEISSASSRRSSITNSNR